MSALLVKEAEAILNQETRRKKNQSRRHTRSLNRNKSTVVVEQIVEEQVIDGSVHYRVKWLNCGSDEDTWEPREALKHLLVFKEYIKVSKEHCKRR